jgi:hypothetical protein
MIKKTMIALCLLSVTANLNANYNAEHYKQIEKSMNKFRTQVKKSIQICDLKDCKLKWWDAFKKGTTKELKILKFNSNPVAGIDYIIEIEATANSDFTSPKKTTWDKIKHFNTSFKPQMDAINVYYDDSSLKEYGNPFSMMITFQQNDENGGKHTVSMNCKIKKVYSEDKKGNQEQTEEINKEASQFLFGRNDLIHSSQHVKKH